MERELDVELRYHVERLIEDYVRDGLSPSEARRRARLEFGGVEQIKEECRDARGTRWFHELVQDLTFSARLLTKERLFTCAAVMALGLGIGINNMLFTIVNASCIRGLPIAGVNRIAYLESRDGQRDGGLSYGDVEEIRSAAQAFDGLAAFTTAPATLAEDDRAPDRVTSSSMSAEGFDIFDGSPMIGRLFGHDDDRPDASPVVVLAGRLWRTRYGADPGVLGRVVRLDGAPATVIGILPDDFRLPGNADVWLPLAQLSPKIRADRGARSLGAVARLRDGITIPGAAEEVDAISTRIAREHHETNAGVRFSAVPLNERYNGRITDPVWIAFMSVGGLLVLIACSNVANLLLARSVQRSREIAIRVSMGATRFRIFRQLLAEGTLLAALGGALGLVFSWLALRAFTSLIPEDGLPFWMSYTMDARVFGVLAGASLTTVILFGLAPALHIARTDVNDLLKQGGRTSSSGTRARRWTAALLSAQFGITMILLSSVGLTLRQFRAAERAAVVVDADHLLTLSVALPAERYGSPDQRRELYSRLRDRLAGADGVSAFAIASHLPFAGGSNSQLAIESRASVNPAVPGVLSVSIGPHYFETMGLGISRGRAFDESDGGPGHETAIVNQRLVGLFFAGENPLGRRIALVPRSGQTAAPKWLTIVGISPTIPQRAVPIPDPVVYLPARSESPASFSLIVRARDTDPASLIGLLREQVRSIDAELPLYQIKTMTRVRRDSGWVGRLSQDLISTIALIALGLSAIGLLAMTLHSVAQRTHELGIRMALGARPGAIVALVLRGGLVQVAIGLAVGVVFTAIWERLFGTPGMLTSPANLLTVASVMALVGATACLWPARRATRVDPLSALRAE